MLVRGASGQTVTVTDMKTTAYFDRDILAKRPYLRRQFDTLQAIVERPLAEVEQADGRFRRWGWVGQEIYRVIVLADGETIHNAFPDPQYRP